MTAQNITYAEFQLENDPVLIIDGIGSFKVELLSQTPGVYPDVLQDPPFATIQQQNSFIQRKFDFGFWVGVSDQISRAPSPDYVYTPQNGQPGFQFGVQTQTSYQFPQYGSAAGDTLTKELSFFALAFDSPSKLWALNKNPLTTLSIRVWNWI